MGGHSACDLFGRNKGLGCFISLIERIPLDPGALLKCDKCETMFVNLGNSVCQFLGIRLYICALFTNIFVIFKTFFGLGSLTHKKTRHEPTYRTATCSMCSGPAVTKLASDPQCHPIEINTTISPAGKKESEMQQCSKADQHRTWAIGQALVDIGGSLPEVWAP